MSETAPQSRIPRLVLSFAIVLSLTTAWQSTRSLAADDASATTPRRNVLFIAVDDLNDWIGCLKGHPQSRTPNFDRLARMGVLFSNAHCSAPACNPSRASLLTGRRPTTSGVYLNSQPWRPVLKDAITLPRLFRENGYEVNGAGKIFHANWNDPTAWDDYQVKGQDPKPSQEVLADPHSRAGGIVWGRLDSDDSQMADFRTVSYTIKQLEQDHSQPFFLACGLYRPHMPWQVPQNYYDQYPIESIVLPEVPKDDLGDLPAAAIKMAKPEGDHATIQRTDNWRHAVQAYLASIAFADAQLGRLLDTFEQSPFAKNTIVVLWGDHGWHLGEKEHWRKFALWEEATHTPMMMMVPGVTKAGTVCNQPVEHIHIYPTLVELCGLPAPDRLDGHSFVSLLKNPESSWNHPALTTHGRGNTAVRSQHYRYIRYASGDEELYDHRTDPDEWKNLVDLPESQPVIQQLAAFLPKTQAANAPMGKDNEIEGGEANEGDEMQSRTGNRSQAGKGRAARRRAAGETDGPAAPNPADNGTNAVPTGRPKPPPAGSSTESLPENR